MVSPKWNRRSWGLNYRTCRDASTKQLLSDLSSHVVYSWKKAHFISCLKRKSTGNCSCVTNDSKKQFLCDNFMRELWFINLIMFSQSQSRLLVLQIKLVECKGGRTSWVCSYTMLRVEVELWLSLKTTGRSKNTNYQMRQQHTASIFWSVKWQLVVMKAWRTNPIRLLWVWLQHQHLSTGKVLLWCMLLIQREWALFLLISSYAPPENTITRDGKCTWKYDHFYQYWSHGSQCLNVKMLVYLFLCHEMTP